MPVVVDCIHRLWSKSHTYSTVDLNGKRRIVKSRSGGPNGDARRISLDDYHDDSRADRDYVAVADFAPLPRRSPVRHLPPYGLTRADIASFLGQHTAFATAKAAASIHIIMDRMTGKPYDCYVEIQSTQSAQAIVNLRNSLGHSAISQAYEEEVEPKDHWLSWDATVRGSIRTTSREVARQLKPAPAPPS